MKPPYEQFEDIPGKTLLGNFGLGDGPASALASDVVKALLNLGNVDNTSDAEKPVSDATKTALNGKQAASAVLAALALLSLTAGNAGKQIQINAAGDGFTLVDPVAGSAIENYTTPLEHGAKGDGVTDDTTAVLAALNTGKIVDGLGLSYALSAELKPTKFGGFRNAALEWVNEAAMKVQGRSLLHIQGLSNWRIDGVDFDMGSVLDCGSNNDSGRRGLLVDASSGWCNRIWVTNCNGTGKGNGTTFDIRNTRSAKIIGNTSHDRSMIFTSGQSVNDAMDGFLFGDSDDIIAIGNHAYDQTTSTNGGASFDNQNSRGFCLSGLQNGIIANNHARLVDQGFDFSGNLDNNGGNRGLVIDGNTGTYCFSWAFKFVHGIKNCTINGCIARYTGRCGFVFNSDDYADPTDHTSWLWFTNCHAICGWAQGTGTVARQTGFKTPAANNQWRGFRTMSNNPANTVRNLRLDLCSAFDDANRMDYGFDADNTSDKTSSIYRNCEAIAQGANSNFIAAHSGGIAASSWRTL